MKLNRSHPAVPRDKKWALQLLCMHALFTLMFSLIFYSTIFFELRDKNIYQICANIIILVIYFIVSIDYMAMVWYQDNLISLIDTMKADYEVAKTLPHDEQVLVWKYVRTGIYVAKVWLVVAVSTANLFPVQSIIFMIYYALIGDFKFVPAYEVKYVTPLEEIKNDLIPFWTLFMIMTFYEMYSMCIFGGVVPLGPIFLTHACGQLAIVEHRIYRTFPRHGYNSETAIKSLTECIKLLQNIYR